MASVSLSSPGSNNGGQCWVSISGLSAAWNTTNYSSAGITTTSFTNGQASQPSGTVSSVSAPSSGSSTSFGWTATGLGYDTKTYYAWVKGAGSGGLYWSAGSASITIPAPTPDPPYGISASPSGNTCSISFGKGSLATSTDIYCWKLGWDHENSTSGTVFSILGLEYDTTYSFYMRSYNSTYGTYSAWTATQSFTTGSPPAPSPPTNVSHSVSGQNCTISFTKGANAYGTRIFYWGSTGPENGLWVDTTGTSFTLTGLGNNVTYWYNLQSYSSGYTAWSTYTADYTFTTEVGRPSNFNWTTSYVSGGDAQIDANDWQYFKSKINEFRQYKGIGSYSYSYTPIVNDDLAATDFTQVRNALSALSAYMTGSYTGGNLIPVSQSVGNDVYAVFFPNLQNSLNSIS